MAAAVDVEGVTVVVVGVEVDVNRVERGEVIVINRKNHGFSGTD